jgi:hypothetical protein
LVIASALPGVAAAACPSPYNTADCVNDGATDDICTIGSYSVSCELVNGTGSTGGGTIYVYTPSAGNIRAMGTDDAGDAFCCEGDLGTEQAPNVNLCEFNQSACPI